MTLTHLAPRRLTAGLVVSVSTDPMGTVVTFRGEADAYTLPLVVDALTAVIADHDGAIIVDLAATEFIDSGTVRALGRAWQYLADHGRPLALRAPSRPVTRVLGLLGLSFLIEGSAATPPRLHRLRSLPAPRIASREPERETLVRSEPTMTPRRLGSHDRSATE